MIPKPMDERRMQEFGDFQAISDRTALWVEDARPCDIRPLIVLMDQRATVLIRQNRV